ncbi:LAFE_0E07580g1_1 [Lachancea fermentati]|uniref:DNA repair protein RAD59 n=1 Tax=Lachancea fermentati TaxID=4955 RepID=A0A1G4MD53_LACFM|nr:LAFE_0E07580g1_1 [Lachancea fermentati]
MTNLSYEGALYEAAPGVTLDDLNIVENWINRPASEWAVQKIGVLQSKIEQYTYKIYHSNRYGKHALSKLIPIQTIIQYANESFGYNGWSVEVLEVRAVNLDVKDQNSDSIDKELYTVTTEARIKVTLKDGTNTSSDGFGKATTSSKGESHGRSKKDAIHCALKKCFLQFEGIVLEHERKVDTNYYVDGLYGSKMDRK